MALCKSAQNVFVNNDYTNEGFPKFELLRDRIEITSAGSLPNGLSRDEFFEGYSVSRNQEIMCIFKDLDSAEHLGFGLPLSLDNYAKDCFTFSDNFLRRTLTHYRTSYRTSYRLSRRTSRKFN